MEIRDALKSLQRFPTDTVNKILGELNAYKRILREFDVSTDGIDDV